MVGSYRCHCDGNVDEQTGNCVPGGQIATTELPFEPVTVADDGKRLKETLYSRMPALSLLAPWCFVCIIMLTQAILQCC